jgi:hypothetical protein
MGFYRLFVRNLGTVVLSYKSTHIKCHPSYKATHIKCHPYIYTILFIHLLAEYTTNLSEAVIQSGILGRFIGRNVSVFSSWSLRLEPLNPSDPLCVRMVNLKQNTNVYR